MYSIQTVIWQYQVKSINRTIPPRLGLALRNNISFEEKKHFFFFFANYVPGVVYPIKDTSIFSQFSRLSSPSIYDCCNITVNVASTVSTEASMSIRSSQGPHLFNVQLKSSPIAKQPAVYIQAIHTSKIPNKNLKICII